MLGKRLRDLRGSRTQEEIAERLGISRARYSHYENERVQPDTELLSKMAELHNVTVDYLLGNDQPFTHQLPQQVTESIIREIVERYNLDLTEEGMKEKLETIVRLVAGDQKRSN